MTKLGRLSGFRHSFAFSFQTEQFDAFYERFLEGDLGKVYIAVPWDELVTAFKLEESKKSPRSIFSSKGKLAPMFLKNFSGFSDRKLMEQLSGNLDWLFFSDIYLGADRLANFKMIGQIRCELAKKLDMDKLEGLLSERSMGEVSSDLKKTAKNPYKTSEKSACGIEQKNPGILKFQNLICPNYYENRPTPEYALQMTDNFVVKLLFVLGKSLNQCYE